jgi:ABC-type sugar transport system ATPase subunit
VAEGVAPRLWATGIEKKFGATRALSGASLEVAPGEVHALLGENGAGKSTLMKIVSGVYTPDAGELRLDGEPFRPRSPRDALGAGVAIVHQEPSVCPDLSVAENVLLGAEPTRFSVVERQKLRERAERALAMVRAGDADSQLSPTRMARELAPAELQLVCIARALAESDCRLLILDEPTASLAAHDVARLFDVVRSLSARGIAVLYISHFLEEVRSIAQRFTVIRDGRDVKSGDIADVSLDDLVEWMTGRRVTERPERQRKTPGDVVLSAKQLAGVKLPADASFELRAGEVLGIAGLVGSGRSEVLRAIFGLDRVRSGEVRVRAVAGPATPARRLAQGVGLLSEDRKREGLAEELSLADNLTLSRLPAWVRPRELAAITSRFIAELGIRAAGPGQRARELSGGNQQKLALARLLHHDVDVLLLDEPTRGIDVSSRLDVYRLIDELAARGKAVLVVSSQFPELLAICDRIAVMHRGTLAAARPASELDEHALVREAAGA